MFLAEIGLGMRVVANQTLTKRDLGIVDEEYHEDISDLVEYEEGEGGVVRNYTIDALGDLREVYVEFDADSNRWWVPAEFLTEDTNASLSS